MSLQDLATIVGIAAIMISGLNAVLIIIAKGFWNLVIRKLEERLTKLEKAEEKNEAFRHKHEASVKSLLSLLETFKTDIDRRFDGFEKLLLSKLDTELLRQQIKNNREKNN